MVKFQDTGKGENGDCYIHNIKLKQRKDKKGFYCTRCAGIMTQKLK